MAKAGSMIRVHFVDYGNSASVTWDRVYKGRYLYDVRNIFGFLTPRHAAVGVGRIVTF